ncbi:BREX system P-loop protein BrxC [Thauera sp.]|uniref:BREX system P-loop protein BrxC n=1 Tax=Thauera sp. TaxID=1905334 RepID=UPI002A370762|nr:BREX system P-loop protein BrxC [Thauera sp.]MDX9887450.1 BREX system P-loop protein BrxC [Thauera sp.]
MLNRDIYVKSPEQNRLANNGVAEVSEDHSAAALAVLRYELETFVCDGQYEKGIETILSTFLRNLGTKSEQPGVWISGFYGSGKSHLAKMLRALWTDLPLPGGASARGLADLPAGVSDQLKELSTQGKRNGGLHAAAGKLGGGVSNVRLALLGIVFRSAGLPELYAQAQIVVWMKREGIYDAVCEHLASAGRKLEAELIRPYVSKHLAEAILHAIPGFADSEQATRQFLKAQFPEARDVTNQQMTTAIQEALAPDGRFPLTLVVLDEVQQYIGSDAEKAYMVQEVTETLSKHFNGLLLFVGTGQSALSGMPNLQRLMGRFPVQVTLGDWDVENVTRKIILAKKSTALPDIDRVWRDNLGEISRHLRGTKLEHVTDDEAVITADYPILPVRRRFWENILRTIDATGTVAQLRSQLRVVHEAALETAEQPLGHVVSGDFLYDQIAANLVSTAQLSREIFEAVQKFAAGDASSQLKARLLKLIYLINKLPAEKALAIGLKPTEDVLADLLVTDLKGGSTELRRTIPALLDELQEKDHLVMALDGPNGAEYHLQTRESSAWYDEFRSQESQLKASPQNVEVKRADFFKARFRAVMSKVRAVQGSAPEVRTLSACFDEALPKDNDKALYLWIQDGWQTDEKSVVAEARAKSAENPTLFAYMPAQSKTDLANAIVTLEAAKATLSRKGTPNTEEGRNAQRSMESRQRNAEKEIETLLNTLFAGVRVFQAGGQEVTQGNDLAERLNAAVKSSVIRLYREFDVADQKGWDKVLDEARKGNAEAMRAVGHLQEPKSHPVCQKILGFLGAGKKGADIRDNFESPPYGWPRDTIDGALYILLATGELKARDTVHKAVDAKSLERSKLTQAFFEPESVNITPIQKIKIRTLFQNLGIGCQPGEELAKAPAFIDKVKSLAATAGGPAPQPEPPSAKAITALEQASGNGLLLELVSKADELTVLAKQWEQTAQLIQRRLPLWNQLDVLLDYATSLGPYAELKAEVAAISAQRSLLAEPDPVRPVLERATDTLRKALTAKLDAYRAEHEAQMAQLEADSNWQKLDGEKHAELIRAHHIDPPVTLDLSTAEKLADALDDCDLQRWIERTQALTTRFAAVRMDAAKLLKPNVVQVKLPQRTLNDVDEVRAWLAEVEQLLLAQVAKGPLTF